MALWDFRNLEVNTIGDVKCGLWLFATTVSSIIHTPKSLIPCFSVGMELVRDACVKGPLFLFFLLN